VTFLGNAPAGVYKTKPNKEVGEKVTSQFIKRFFKHPIILAYFSAKL